MSKDGASGPSARKLLTEVECRNAEPRAKRWRLSDGNHLFLLIMPNGKKYWQVRYFLAGRDQLFSIGRYVENADGPRAFGLRAAREARNEIMAAIDAGFDPLALKRDARSGNSPAPPKPVDAGERSVRAVASAWMEHRAEGLVPDYVTNIQRRFELDVFPAIGGMDVADVTRQIILNDVLRPIEARGARETARRLRQHIEAVFTYAEVEGFLPVDHDNPASQKLVVSLKKPNKGGRRPATTDIDKLRELLIACEAEAAHPTVRLACRLQHLVVLRPGELRQARWEQFEGLDGPEPTWRVPGSVMKMREPFVVPLSRQAVDALRALRTLNGGHPIVFPGEKNPREPISENAVLFLIYRAGGKGTHSGHGSRAAFSSIMNRRYPLLRHAIDISLAHKPYGDIEAAYNRDGLVEVRRPLMQEWADILLDGFPPAADLLRGPRH